MNSLTLPSILARQPQGVVQLNAQNRFVSGAIVYPLAARNTILGSTPPGVPTIGGAIAPRVAEVGRYFSLGAGQADFIRLGINPAMQVDTFSALIVFRLPALPASGGAYTLFESGSLADGNTGNSNGSFQFRVGDDGGFQIIKDNTVAVVSGPAGSIAAGRFYTAMVSNATGNTGRGNTRVVINGLTAFDVATNVNDYKAGNFTIGTKDGTTAEKGALDVALFVYWPRDSRAADMVEITKRPWQLFKAPTRRLLVADASAATLSASMAWTEGSDAASVGATVTDNAAAAWTEQGDGMSLAGTVAVPGAAAAVAWTEAGDAAAAAGTVTDRASMAWTEQGDSASIAGDVARAPDAVSAAVAWTEGGDAAAIAARAIDLASIGFVEQGDTWAVAGQAEQPPVIKLTVRFDVLPRNFRTKITHFSN